MRRQSVSQVYMNFMEIKPIKMTVSVSFDANIKGEFEPNWINFLALIPSGVENAIIAVDSYIFHHIDSGKARILSTLR